MTRFRAYASDSSSSDDEEEVKRLPPRRVDNESESEESEEFKLDEESQDETSSDGSMSSSEMLEHELVYGGRSRRRPRKALVEDENGEMQLEGDDDEDESSSSSSSSRSESPGPRGVPGDPNIIPWARQIGVDAQKLHVMQASFFGGGGEAAALKAMTEAKPRYKALALQPSLNRKHSRDSDGDGARNESREVRQALFSCVLPGTDYILEARLF
jgi:nuclear pore complex protein Nup98-Nup96